MSLKLHTPSISAIEEHDSSSATFVIEPLHTGYGQTLGNSLRRVLLSSISGAAVISFRIKGASHEFTTIPGVRDDVLQIMLNLKGLRFRMFTDEPQIITVSKKGSGDVTGADITVNADIEVVNKNHVITSLDSSTDSFEMELMIGTGRGYRTLETSLEEKPTDMIAIDSIFSPVLRVRYRVENTRVGDMTDLDKLNLTIDTDGTITPKEAFEEAAAILQSQYAALAGATVVETAPFATQTVTLEAASSEDEPEELMVSVEDLGFNARTTNALINNDIHTLRDLVNLTDVEMKELKGFGSKALDQVRDRLAEMEL